MHGRRRGGPFGEGPQRAHRARRGDVRAAILSLLSQEGQNGYRLMKSFDRATDGAWRPSPGSIYPTLTQLQDEGLIVAVGEGRTSEFQLTDAGRGYIVEHADELEQAWKSATGQSEQDLAFHSSVAKLHGCRDVKVAMATTPFTAVSYGSNKRIERDCQFMLWIETPGPAGYWLELRRSYSFGPPSPELQGFWTLVQEIWAEALPVIRPGATGADVLAVVERRIAGQRIGLSPSNYSLHGIGADAIEGMWAPGNDKPLLAGEVVSFHPSLTFDDPGMAERLSFIGMTDNVVVTPQGGVRLTYQTDELRIL